jgi:hypothetical protein
MKGGHDLLMMIELVIFFDTSFFRLLCLICGTTPFVLFISLLEPGLFIFNCNPLDRVLFYICIVHLYKLYSEFF